MVKRLECVVLHGKPISELRSVICHMKSQSVICHSMQKNVPRLNLSRGWYSIYLLQRDGQAELTWWLVIYRDDLPACRQSLI